MIDALRERESLQGLFVIVDARRGLAAGDEALLDWAAPHHRVHVLLSKADKLNRSEGMRTLKDATAALGGRGSVQLFSAVSKTGVEEAQRTLEHWLEAPPAA
jgi:GTP-binding protein